MCDDTEAISFWPDKGTNTEQFARSVDRELCRPQGGP